MIDSVDLYIPGMDGSLTIQHNGDGLPFSVRQIQNKHPIFPIETAPGTSRIYYLRFDTDSAVNMPLKIFTPIEFLNYLSRETPVFWLYYGLLLSMIIYNLFLFFSVRDRNFLYYVLFLVSYVLFQMTLNGFSFEYLWPNSIWWANNCLPLFMCLAYFWGIQSGRHFMSFKKNLPRYDKLVLFCLGVSVFGMILSMVAPYRIAIRFTTFFIPSVMVSVFGSFYLAFKGERPAIFFAVSWGVLLTGITVFALKTLGVLPHNFFTQWAIQISSAWQATFLGLGLADQLNLMKKKLQEMNVGLESKVVERTQALKSARDALWGEMELAKKIQTVLLPKVPKIEGYDVAAYMATADEVGGDYYDVIHVGGRTWIVIGDVSGHGVPAGLVMMMVQTAINVSISQNPLLTPSQLLESINTTITKNIKEIGDGLYMTITVFAVLDDGQIEFSGLHQDVLLYRARQGVVETVPSAGFWIGVTDDIHGMLQNDRLLLNAGDTMLIYTDGITEARRKRNPEDTRESLISLFGLNRLMDILATNGRKQPEEIKRAILEALGDFECLDDVTLVVVRRKDSVARATATPVATARELPPSTNLPSLAAIQDQKGI